MRFCWDTGAGDHEGPGGAAGALQQRLRRVPATGGAHGACTADQAASHRCSSPLCLHIVHDWTRTQGNCRDERPAACLGRQSAYQACAGRLPLVGEVWHTVTAGKEQRCGCFACASPSIQSQRPAVQRSLVCVSQEVYLSPRLVAAARGGPPQAPVHAHFTLRYASRCHAKRPQCS